jgi:ribosomal protein L3 glutamine methyltransferase
MKETDTLNTLRDLVRFAMSRFNEAGIYYGHGTDNALDEAMALVLHTLHLPHDLPHQMLAAQLTHSEREKILALIERRISARIPLPYLTHEAWFAGLAFYVDERVLVPRSPIAELIQQQFEPWLGGKPVKRILDLCTGSGCIAIACAMYFPDAVIDASDISTDALAVAKMNITRHAVESRVHLQHSSLFDAFSQDKTKPEKKYDLIISNPPYVNHAEMLALPAEYQHEPALGLSGGKEGLDIILQILRTAPDYLTPDGLLVVEAGNSETALEETLPDIPFIWPEFKHGDGGVFILNGETLRACSLNA